MRQKWRAGRRSRRWSPPAAAARALALLALMLLPETVFGAGTFYVDAGSATCSDTGPGTTALPYCTMTAAVGARGGPGITVFVKPSVYREQVNLTVSGSSGSPFLIQALGSPVVVDGADDLSAPTRWSVFSGSVWLAASVSWTPLQVFVDGTALTTSSAAAASLPSGTFRYISGQGLYVNLGGDSPGVHQTFVGRRQNGFRLSAASWVSVDGFTVTRTESQAILVSGSAGNVRITNNNVSHANSHGIVASGSAGVAIAANVVSHNNDHGIYLTSSTGATVQDNESSFNARPAVRAANGIHLNGSSGNLVQRNRVHDNQDSGLQINASSNSNVSLQNRSWNNGDHGYDHLTSTGNLHVGDVAWHNFKDGFSIEGTSTGTRLVDCIAAENGLTIDEFDLFVDAASVSGYASDYDIFWNSVAQTIVKYNGSRYATMGAFTAATGKDPHGIQADPRFANPGAGEFHLLSSSPAIDSADSSAPNWPALDAEGVGRFDIAGVPNTGAGSVPYADRGALEFVTGCSIEICNGSDDDCDGAVDEGFDVGAACTAGVGACARQGTKVCAADGGSTVCNAVPGSPLPELCNTLDDDCDGSVDEGFDVGAPCAAGVGACARQGTKVCAADGGSTVCNAVPGPPLPELCNTLDDDCDGAVDEGFDVGAACSAGQGACQRQGTRVCSADGGATVCNAAAGSPAPELCNALDDDCDGAVDEGFDPGAPCAAGLGACERQGTKVCATDGAATVCNASPGSPIPELCNALDDDCDGSADNGFDVGAPCTSGVGACQRQGAKVCVSHGASSACNVTPGSPTLEICNGIDDDCNGTADEGDPGGGAPCGTDVGACTLGTETCSEGRVGCLGGIGPSAERCDGLDNNCDGTTDEGFDAGAACAAGVGACRREGTRVCSQDGAESACDAVPGSPEPEICDRIDNDCDGTADNGFDVGALCTLGIGACAAQGTKLCASDGSGTLCAAVAGEPAPEICDGIDNDCNGSIDDGEPGAGTPCGTDLGECVLGLAACRDGRLDCEGSVGPAPEICDGLDNDCDGAIDNALPPDGSVLLTLSPLPGSTRIAWIPRPDTTRCDLVRGDLGILSASGGNFTDATQFCLASGSPANTVEDPDWPSAGSGFWYLVRGINCGGPGTYDSGTVAQQDGRDEEIDASPAACP